jgi:late competence protein required for DNA uptake (superfamily II DNA/RNA helicase)
MKKQILPIGLYPLFTHFCKINNYQYKLNFNENLLSTKISDKKLESLYESVFKNSKFNPRNYQKEAIANSIRNKRGIILSPTASGKSIVIYVLIRFLLYVKKNCLLVVPNVQLTEQMYSDFKDYGWNNIHEKVSVLYSGQKYDESKPVLISTWQSLQNKDQEFFDRFGGLMIDECFHPDSLITLANGKKKKIKDIVIGEKIKSLNERTNKIENKGVMTVYHDLKPVSELYYIEDDNGNIHFEKGITGNHQVKTTDGWKRVDQLTEGDCLIGGK